MENKKIQKGTTADAVYMKPIQLNGAFIKPKPTPKCICVCTKDPPTVQCTYVRALSLNLLQVCVCIKDPARVQCTYAMASAIPQ